MRASTKRLTAVMIQRSSVWKSEMASITGDAGVWNPSPQFLGNAEAELAQKVTMDRSSAPMPERLRDIISEPRERRRMARPNRARQQWESRGDLEVQSP